VQAPTDGLEEHEFILVDLKSVEARNFAPGASGVVAVLQIFGSEDQCGEKHPTPTLHRPQKRLIPRLLLGEVMCRDVGLDFNQIIQGHLQGTITSTGAAECFLDKCAERKNPFRAGRSITAGCRGGEGPNGLNDL
jgi:hypothetical protein